jgi:hypothetical protein
LKNELPLGKIINKFVEADNNGDFREVVVIRWVQYFYGAGMTTRESMFEVGTNKYLGEW